MVVRCQWSVVRCKQQCKNAWRTREVRYHKGIMVSIRKHLSSETIHLPEAAALVGKDVHIIIVEEPSPRQPRDLSELDRLAGKIDLDYEAIEDLRRRRTI